MNTPFGSQGLIYRFLEQVFRWRWRIFILGAIIILAYGFLIWRLRLVDNLWGFDTLYLFFPAAIILLVFGVTLLSLFKTRSIQPETVHFSNLQRELGNQLLSVKEWDDIVSILFGVITNHLPLRGLSLLVHNQISKKYEIVAEKFSSYENEQSVHYLPLINDGEQIALVSLYLFPDLSYPSTKIEMIRSLTPEITSAVERIGLLHTLTEQTQAIQRKEQDRIARHLHDTIANDLAYLCLKFDQLSSTEYLDGSAALRSEIEYMHSIANKAYTQTRYLLRELRDDYHQELPCTDFVSDVKECALHFGERANFHVTITTDGNPTPPSSQIQRQILYLVREALRNIEKHANAQNANLILSWEDNGLTIMISDDGQGFDVSMRSNVSGHYGLGIIEDIVHELNGTLFVETGQNEGTRLTLSLPIN